jgi:hypothetical protein
LTGTKGRKHEGTKEVNAQCDEQAKENTGASASLRVFALSRLLNLTGAKAFIKIGLLIQNSGY